MKKRIKPYSEMTSAELAEATKQFDREFVIDKARPLTAVERARRERMKRWTGPPRGGQPPPSER